MTALLLALALAAPTANPNLTAMAGRWTVHSRLVDTPYSQARNLDATLVCNATAFGNFLTCDALYGGAPAQNELTVISALTPNGYSAVNIRRLNVAPTTTQLSIEGKTWHFISHVIWLTTAASPFGARAPSTRPAMRCRPMTTSTTPSTPGARWGPRSSGARSSAGRRSRGRVARCPKAPARAPVRRPSLKENA